MVRVKPGVAFTVIAPAGWMILAALKRTARILRVPLTITSACDGVHSGPTDPHARGEAYDVRSHDLDPALRPKVLALMRVDLGTAGFYGALEDAGTSNAHFHFQIRKGTVLSVEDFLAA